LDKSRRATYLRAQLKKALEDYSESNNSQLPVRQKAEKKHPIQLLASKVAERFKAEKIHSSTVDLLTDFMRNLLCCPTGRRFVN